MDFELNELKREIANLQLFSNRQYEQIQNEITLLSDRLMTLELKKASQEQVEETPLPTQEETQPETIFSSDAQSLTQEEPAQVETIVTPHIPKTPKKKAVPLSTLLFNALLSFGPLESFKDWFMDVYLHYKEEKKLPVFFLTIFGFAAMIIGVGFLLQQVATQYFNIGTEWVVLILGGSTTSVLLLWSKKLHHKDERYQEFASAIQALMISMNYLIIAFVINNNDSSWLGSLLILLNTSLSLFIAFRFETRIVATLTLLGGALAPMMLESSSAPIGYLVYLLLLISASIYVGKRIKWESISYLGFALGVVLMELIFNDLEQTSSTFPYLIYAHVFTYFFIYIGLFDGKKLRPLEKENLGLLITNLAIFLTNIYLLSPQEHTAGWLYVANAVIPITVLLKFRKTLSKKYTPILIAMATGLTALGIQFLFTPSLKGIVWGAEALLLMYFGYAYSIKSLRNQGQLLYLVAVATILYRSVAIISMLTVDYTGALFTEAFIHWIEAGVLFAFMAGIAVYFNRKINDIDTRQIAKLQEGLLAIWSSITFAITAFYFLDRYAFCSFLIPMLTLLYWGNKRERQLINLLGWASGALILVGFFYGIGESEALVFHQQPAYGKTAAILSWLVMWSIRYYFQYILQDKKHWSKHLQTVAYLIIPIAIIGSFNRHLPNLMNTGLWVGMLGSFILYQVFQKNVYRIQTYFILITALLTILMRQELIWINVLSGFIILTALFFYLKGYKMSYNEKAAEWKGLLRVAVYYVPIVGGIVFWEYSGNLYQAILVTLVPSLMIALAHKQLTIVKGSLYKYFWIMTGLFGALVTLKAIMWVVFDSTPITFTSVFITALLNIAYLGFAYGKKSWLKENGQKVALWVFNITLVATYALVLNYLGIHFSNPAFTVLLVIHGILILFHTTKPNYQFLNRLQLILLASGALKLFLFDLSGFSLVEKTIAFIIVGLLCLGAAFGWMKLRNKSN
ncbi:DUF2339 domain-containing protein [Limibacter armeniacum]|uniref:DUF2339 domain-containing protein n=1 Tax=Limibacter armeniacum TaxID=466084 RepID=UPI002FE571FD